MTYFVDNYPEGAFCWADVVSPDFDKTKNFLMTILKWEADDNPNYTMFKLKGKDVAGGMQTPKEMSKIPSHWNSFVSVDDIEESYNKAKKLGAKELVPPSDAGAYGRMAGIIDPTGAPLMLWQAKESIGAEVVNDVGAMVWNQLNTNNAEAAAAFYQELFGWKLDHIKDRNIYIILNQGRRNGSIMQIPAAWGNIPSNWVVYFTVKDLDASLAKVQTHGGKVIGEKTRIETGIFSLVQEPAGAYFILLEFITYSPQEWDA